MNESSSQVGRQSPVGMTREREKLREFLEGISTIKEIG
jgi:ribosomal protein S2